MGLGQNGQDFNVNGLVHIHGGTVTLPREVRMIHYRTTRDTADSSRTGSAYAQNCRLLRSHSTS